MTKSFNPHSSIGERPLAALVAILAISIMLPSFFYGLPFGKAITGGLRIMDGEVPYRDFWSMYAPGMFYFQALLFSIFGKTIVPQAIAVLLIVAAGAALMFSVSYRLSAARFPAIMLGIIYVGMQWPGPLEFVHYQPAFLLIFVALERVYRYVSGGDARRLLVQAGLALGLAAWFKHDIAAYFALGAALGLTLSWQIVPARPDNWLPPVRAVIHLAAASLAAAAPMLVWLAIQAGPDAWNNLIVFPVTDYRAVRSEGLPSLIPNLTAVSAWLSTPDSFRAAHRVALDLSSWILFYLPVAAFITGVVTILRRRESLAPIHASFAIVLLTCMPLFWNAMLVQQNTHALTLAVFSFLLGALSWRYLGVSRPALRGLLALAAFVYAVGLAAEPSGAAYLMAGQWNKSRVIDTPLTGPVRVSQEVHDVYRTITDFVVANTASDEPIYSGVMRHDVPVIGNQRFYYLADRPVATKYMEMHPAITDSVEVQREMIGEFELTKLRCVILWRFGWTDEVLDAIQAHRMAVLSGLGSTLLDEWLQTEFEPVFDVHQYVVLWRKDVVPPREIPASVSQFLNNP